MMENTNRVQQGASEVGPLLVIIIFGVFVIYDNEMYFMQPLSTAREVNSAQCKERLRVHNDQHMLGYSLLQVLTQQQTHEKQQQNIVPNIVTSSRLELVENQAAEIVNVNESHIGNTIPGILDNVLNPEEKTSIFNTSSDTVNKLLRGLSSTSESDSIRKLSEETASVLPSFAKALGQSSQPLTDGLSFHQLEDKNSDASGIHLIQSQIGFIYKLQSTPMLTISATTKCYEFC